MTERLASRLKTARAIVLDMDGVVVDSEPLHERAQEKVFAANGLPVPKSEHASFKGRTERDVFTIILQEYGSEHHDLMDLVGQKHAAYRELLPTVQPVLGALEFIAGMHGRYVLGLATSAAAENQQFIFEQLNLRRFFETIVTSGDVRHSKPHPDPYLIATRRLNIPPQETIVIEDSRLGIRSALAAGCTTIGLVGTFSRADLEAEKPDLIIDRFEDLTRLLSE